MVIGAVVGAIALSRRGSPIITDGSDAFPNLQIQPLTLTGDITSGVISPDGKFVAYVRKNAGVWVRQISADHDIQVAPFVKDRTYDSVTFTPDVSSIDFAAAEGQQRNLWRVALLGGTPRRVVSDIWSAPGWSPDGQRMAFIRTKGPDQETSIVVVEKDGSRERVLVTRQPSDGFLNMSWGVWATNRPAWSPDGKRLALVATVAAPQPTGPLSELVVVDATTGAESRAFPIKADGLAWDAAWLDDTHVLLNTSTSFNSLPGLWSLDLTSDTWIPITRDFAQFHGISLTTDRRTGVATRTERRSGIWLGDASGQDGTLVLPETLGGPAFPALDLAGGIAYSAYTGNGVSTLYRLGPGAQRATVLGEVGITNFAVSPDGRFAVFSSSFESPLSRVNSDGTGSVKLVEKGFGGPAVTPDGKTVLFSPFGAPGLFSVPLNGGPVRELSKAFVGTAPSVSPDGTRLLFASSKPGISVLCDLPDCTNSRELELTSSQWAPSGQGVAYVNEEDQGNLWEQPLDGRPQRRLTNIPDAQILEFAWSPDYKRLALARGRMSDDIVLLKGLR